MTGYTSVFGGNTVAPSDESYTSLTLSANTVLSWPRLGASSPTANDTIDVSATAANLSLSLPDATLGTNGATFVINSIGNFSFALAGFTGQSLGILAPSTGYLVYLIDNSTKGGTWRLVQVSSGTSGAQASALQGAGLVALNGTLNEAMPFKTFNSTYTTGPVDRALTLLWTGGAGTLTIPSVALLTNNWFVGVKNGGSGVLTIGTTGCNIDGGTTVSLNPNDAALLFTDGSNVWTFGKGQAANFVFSYIAIDVSGTGNYTLTSSQVNQVAYKFTGTLTGNRTVLVPNTVQQYWISNQTSGAYSLTMQAATGSGTTVQVAQSGNMVLWCDGTNIIPATSSGVISSIPVGVNQGGTGATTADAALTNLGGTAVGEALFKSANQAAAQTAIGVYSMAQDDSNALLYALVL